MANYRISFVLVGGSDKRIHIAVRGDEFTFCKTKMETFHQLVNLTEIKKLPFCKTCQEAYHERSERNFAVIN